jgi:predicted kinase
MKPTAILLCGLPYSGKSSLAAALAHDGYRVISLTDINHERGLGWNGDAVPGSEWMESHHVALNRLRALIAMGQSVVWDDTNYAAWIRDPIFEAVESAGGEPVIVFVDTPVEVVRARAEAAEIQGDPERFPHDDFERVLREFERPCCGIRIDGTLKSATARDTLRNMLRREVAPRA